MNITDDYQLTATQEFELEGCEEVTDSQQDNSSACQQFPDGD